MSYHDMFIISDIMTTKVALLVGCNYPGTTSELKGCHNDVDNIAKLLCDRFGYEMENITVLKDDGISAYQPTRQNILQQLSNMILSGARQMYFHYSGHGTYVTDTSGDEDDGRDECLVPCDYMTQGLLLDDHLHAVCRLMQSHQRLFCVLDCCHSGTGLDLGWNAVRRMNGRTTWVADRNAKIMPGHVVMLSGCQDNQTSADAWINRQAQGAMSWAFIEMVNSCQTIPTLEYAITTVRRLLKKSHYSQYPNMSAGNAYAMSNTPIMLL